MDSEGCNAQTQKRCWIQTKCMCILVCFEDSYTKAQL
jgi:hypothetical protein